MKKVRFRGAFNYRQTAKVMYAYAYTEKQAWVVFCRRLAEKDGVHPSVVMGLFDGSRDNFQITADPV
jgi:hypothetical protein